MNPEKIGKTSRIPSRKKSFREQERYKRNYFGVLFLEILLQKIKEKENLQAAGMTFLPDTNRVVSTEKITEQPEVSVEMKLTAIMPPESKRLDPTDQRKILVWGSGDLLELASAKKEQERSEGYASIIQAVRSVCAFYGNGLFLESSAVMQSYYDGAFDTLAVEEAFRASAGRVLQTVQDRDEAEEELAMVQDYFLRANAYHAVAKNNAEGKRLAEASELSWSGCSYYNSDYYYQCKRIERLLLSIVEEIAEEYDLSAWDAAEAYSFEQEKCRFHEAWVWRQGQNNYPGNQYGMRNLRLAPPPGFCYFYRDYYSQEQYGAYEALKEQMKELFSPAQREHMQTVAVTKERGTQNGRSSLLVEEQYKNWNMEFLANFKLYQTAGCIEIVSGEYW